LKLTRHAGIAALAAIVAPLAIAFCWHGGVASVSDDSVSYLTLAAWLSPWGSELAKPWASYVSHFPPLFPLLLVATGGSESLWIAHLVVAACAVATVPLVHAYASRALGGARAGLLATILFVAAPGFWISMHGILSEPLFLAFTLAALVWHDEGGGEASLRREAILGLLIGAACLTRVAGIALVAAYAVHLAVQSVGRRRLPRASALLPLLVPVLFQGLWSLAKPHGEFNSYGSFIGAIVDRWQHDPDFWPAAWRTFFGGWVALFEGNSEVGTATRGVFLAAWILAVGGALAGAWRNRLAAWYLLASLAMIWVWNFPERMMLRLTFPVLPLMIVHAATGLRTLLARSGGAAQAGRALFAAWLLAALLVAPAAALLAGKAFDREPFAPGLAYSPASTTEYYTTVNVGLAHAVAVTNSTTLVGLSTIDRLVAQGAPVMWVRPEYVAIVAHRPGVPFYFGWSRADLARHIRESGARYLVFCRVYKSDLLGRMDDVYAAFLADPPRYLHRVLTLKGAFQQDDFVLFEVDRSLFEETPR